MNSIQELTNVQPKVLLFHAMADVMTAVTAAACMAAAGMTAAAAAVKVVGTH